MHACVAAPLFYALSTASRTSNKLGSCDTASLPSTRNWPNTPKGWFIQLETMEILKNIPERFALYVCVKHIYHDIGAEHCNLGIIKSVVYKRPVS